MYTGAHLPGGATSTVTEPKRRGLIPAPPLTSKQGCGGWGGVSSWVCFLFKIHNLRTTLPFPTPALSGTVLGPLWRWGEVSVADAGSSLPTWPLVPPTPQAQAAGRLPTS